jgi:hypothetical protein
VKLQNLCTYVSFVVQCMPSKLTADDQTTTEKHRAPFLPLKQVSPADATCGMVMAGSCQMYSVMQYAVCTSHSPEPGAHGVTRPQHMHHWANSRHTRTQTHTQLKLGSCVVGEKMRGRGKNGRLKGIGAARIVASCTVGKWACKQPAVCHSQQEWCR